MATRIETLAHAVIDGLGDLVARSRIDPDSAFVVAERGPSGASVDLYWDRDTLHATIYSPSARTPSWTLTSPTASEIVTPIRDHLTETTP